MQSGANSIQRKVTLTHFDVAGLISTLSISVAFRQQYPFHEMRQCDMGLVAFSRTFGSKATASKATNMQAKDHVQGIRDFICKNSTFAGHKLTIIGDAHCQLQTLTCVDQPCGHSAQLLKLGLRRFGKGKGRKWRPKCSYFRWMTYNSTSKVL